MSAERAITPRFSIENLSPCAVPMRNRKPVPMRMCINRKPVPMRNRKPVPMRMRGSFEKSEPFPATSDWRLIAFDFDSKDRTEVEIGPHLGWHASMVKGTAWFAEVTLVER